MGQYIGARYVPRFMDTYDPSQIYDALDVVDNGLGTSYISRIPTPANTPLTNTTYWKVYGASSGAIINLQNQIDDNTSDITALTKKNVYITAAEYGAVGDGVTDDTTALQNAINAAQTNRATLALENKTYKITSKLLITNPVFIDGNFAKLLVASSISSAIEVNIPNPIASYGMGLVKNLLIDCDYLATSGIELVSNINALQFEHVQINDPLTYGIFGNTGTLIINDLFIRNTDNGHLAVIGVRCDGADNIIVGYTAVNTLKSMVLNGNARIERNASWNSFAGLMSASVYAEVNAHCDFIDCMIDTWATGFDGNASVLYLTNCAFFWNPNYYTDASVGDSTTKPYLFSDNIGTAVLNGCRVFRPSGRSTPTSLFTPTQKAYSYNAAFKNSFDAVYNVPTIGSYNITHTVANITTTTDEYTIVDDGSGKRCHALIIGELSGTASDRTPIITNIAADYKPNKVVIGRAFVGYWSGDLVPVLWDDVNNRFLLITPTGVTYPANTNVFVEIDYYI